MSNHDAVNPIKVQVIDDSALIRKLVAEMINGVSDIEISHSSPNPIIGMKRMERAWPDVLILDMEMPQMDGLTFLRKIMAEKPMPVVVFSSLTEAGAQITLDAISSGAVGVVQKPKLRMGQTLDECAEDLLEAIREASRVDMSVLKQTNRGLFKAPTTNTAKSKPLTPVQSNIKPKAHSQPPTTKSARVVGAEQAESAGVDLESKIVALGTSTGGTQALEFVIKRLPKSVPGIVVVQHMREKFTLAFSQRLNEISEVTVKEAETGDLIQPGVVLIAPGGQHMIVRSTDGQASVVIKDGPPINRHKPSVDVLFNSVADLVGYNRAGFIMTGMGGDGAKGLKAMHDRGALTFAQDEKSCVVYGMPAVAMQLQAVDRQLPLDTIHEEIMAFANAKRVKKPTR